MGLRHAELQQTSRIPLWVTDLSLAGVATTWGLNHVIVKHTLTNMHPLAFNAIRFGLASLTLLVILRLAEGGPARGSGRGAARSSRLGAAGGMWVRPVDTRPVIRVSLLGHTLYQLCFIMGLSLTTAGKTAVILAVSPACVACLEHFTGRERYSHRSWAGILASLLGVALVTAGGKDGLSLAGGELRGDLLVLAATVCWAGYTVTSRPLLHSYSALRITALTISVGTVPLIFVSWPTLMHQPWAEVTSTSWAALLFSFAVPVVIGYILWSWGIQRLGSGRTAIYGNLSPLVASFVGWIVLGETWSLLQLAGAGLILFGITQVRKGQPRARSRQVAPMVDDPLHGKAGGAASPATKPCP